MPSVDKWFPVSVKKGIMLTQKRGLDLKKNLIYSRWSASSRVDLVEVEDKKRYVYGLGSRGVAPKILPKQKYILQDGSAGTFVTDFSRNPESAEILNSSLYSLALKLKERPRVFVIGVGGGHDIWASKINGASYTKGIELNKQILDMHHSVLYDYSKEIVDDLRIDLLNDEGRSALIRDSGKYDIIQMSGIDTWTSLASGAYVLAENYLYTVEAIRSMYNHLNDDGIISISRFAKEMETLRILSNVYEAIKDFGKAPFDRSVACLYNGVFIMTTLVKKGEFTDEELDKLNTIAAENGFFIYYLPNKTLNNTVEKFVRCADKDKFIQSFPRDISPTPDDRPYFFNFTRWNNIFDSRKYLNEKSSVSQGNPLFILGQLVFSTFLALFFIILPVFFFKQKGLDRTHMIRFLIYFAALGLGFIFIEISVMQKLVLFLGHPIYSITVTLFSMLVFTGIGSLCSERWFKSFTQRAWLVPLGLATLLGLFILFSPEMVQAWIVWPRAARIMVTIAILAPISLLLGIPFAYGIRLLNQFNPTLIPWAWAINGCLSVIGSVLTVVISMNFGFNMVLILSILIYFAGFAAIQRIK